MWPLLFFTLDDQTVRIVDTTVVPEGSVCSDLRPAETRKKISAMQMTNNSLTNLDNCPIISPQNTPQTV